MTKTEKQSLKRLLTEWGHFTKTIRSQKAEIAEFKKVCTDIEHARDSAGKCEIISMDSLREKAERLGININSRMSRQGELDEIINDLPYDMQAILRTRYIKGIAWENMPANLPFYMSVRHCYRLHNKALEIIAEKYPDFFDPTQSKATDYK